MPPTVYVNRLFCRKEIAMLYLAGEFYFLLDVKQTKSSVWRFKLLYLFSTLWFDCKFCSIIELFFVVLNYLFH